jgi:hypothetical protein
MMWFLLGSDKYWWDSSTIHHWDRNTHPIGINAHMGAISMDATFGNNDLKFHLSILMVFDSHWTRIPIAWIVISQQTRNYLIEWLAALKVKFFSRMPSWKLACFIIDDAPQELATL